MKQSQKAIIYSVILCIAQMTLAATPGGGLEWPRWRGPDMNDTATGTGLLTPGQTYRLEVVWKQPFGEGYSGVVVAGGVAVSMLSDGTYDYVAALHLDTGTELWRTKIDSTFLGRYGSKNGPLSTPVISKDGNLLGDMKKLYNYVL